MTRYRLVLEHDDNGTILVTSPDFPLVTYGDDVPSALRNAVDAVHGLLASMIDAHEDIPVAPDVDHDGPVLQLPLQTVLKVALYVAMRSAGLTRADLQRKLKWQRESVDRLFRLDHNSKIEQIDEAFNALGKEVDLRVYDAKREMEAA